MIIALYIIWLLIIILVIGKINLTIQFNKEVKELFAQSKNISDKTYGQEQLYDLPEPVQRYFKYALKDGQRYISYASITHNGQFKTGFDKDWINIKGEQYATTEKPGFIWKGTTNIFTARDMYIGDKGRLVVLLFSLLKVGDKKGGNYNQGELLRWLGESILYPTNLLPSERLHWLPVDANSAKLVFKYNQLSLYFIITFNDVGQIIQMETKRYLDESNLETWIIKCNDYKELKAVMIPVNFEVIWRLKKGDFPYAKFRIKTVIYNEPKRLKS